MSVDRTAAACKLRGRLMVLLTPPIRIDTSGKTGAQVPVHASVHRPGPVFIHIPIERIIVLYTDTRSTSQRNAVYRVHVNRNKQARRHTAKGVWRCLSGVEAVSKFFFILRRKIRIAK